MLKVVERESTASLRERMDSAGCVFKFVVLSPESEIEADEGMHRHALIALHELLMAEAMEWYGNLIKNPEFQDKPEPQISWDLENAIATPLSRNEVRYLTSTDRTDIFERLALYACFVNPPYRARFKNGNTEAQSVFLEWCELLGLNEVDDVSVVNWVERLNTGLHGYDDTIESVESWSNYFDAGLEWWGVWCLTIWNPKRRTIGALIASTTD